jgi:hypothetical protein
MEWFASHGAHVFVPVGHSPDVDLIADLGDRLIRVEVKTSAHRNGDRWGVLIATRGGNQSWSGLVKYFDPERCDYLFVHVADGRRWLIPTGVLDCRSGVTLGGPKYAEFEIERGRPFDSDASRIALQAGERRSRRAGPVCKIGGEVLSGFDSHLPHSVASRPPVRPVRNERTRISSKHQITIPSVPFRAAGLSVGDRLHGRANGPGRVILERIAPPGDSLPSNGQPQLELG